MERYRYKARTMDGKKRKGTAEAGNEKLLLKKLKEEGTILFLVCPGKPKGSAPIFRKDQTKRTFLFLSSDVGYGSGSGSDYKGHTNLRTDIGKQCQGAFEPAE